MRSKPLQITMAVITGLAVIAGGLLVMQLPAIGAGALLFPSRKLPQLSPPDGCRAREFTGSAGILSGWQCRAAAEPSRYTVIYLHGIADNRDSGAGTVTRLLREGFDVIAYDSRGHGSSEGDRCTYGFFEKDDVRRVIAQAGVEHSILMGYSLGGAVALQAAAIEPTVRAVIAIATFSDLRTIATERAAGLWFPWFAINSAFARAERDGRFLVDQVSPVDAAPHITAPVLLIHGAHDVHTPPTHSAAIFAALRGPKQLLMVPAGHNDVLRDSVWQEINAWLRKSVSVGAWSNSSRSPERS